MKISQVKLFTGLKPHIDMKTNFKIIQQFLHLKGNIPVLVTWYRNEKGIKLKAEKVVSISQPELKQIETAGFIDMNAQITHFQ